MRRRNPAFLTLVALACSASISGHENPAAMNESSGDRPAAKCEYYTFDDPIPIASDSPGGVTIGPLPIPKGKSTIQGVTLGLEIEYEYAGDLSLFLHYDCNNDGIYEASSPVEFHWAGADPRVGDEGWDCPIKLDGFYYFNSAGWDAIEMPTPLTGPEVGVGRGREIPSLSAFDGCPRGGSFYITIIDHARRGGMLVNWTIYLDKPVGLTERSS